MRPSDALLVALATLAGTTAGAIIDPGLFLAGGAAGLFLGVELLLWNRRDLPDA